MQAPSQTNNAGELLQTAMAHHQAGRLADAGALYELTLRLQPTNFDALHLLGLVRLGQGQVEHGIALIRQAIALYPDFALAYANLGSELNRLGRVVEGLDAYDRAVALAPDLAVAHAGRGRTLRSMGRWGEAAESFGRALAVQPDDLTLLADRGTALFQAQQYEAALAAFDRILALRPGTPDALANRGSTLVALERAAEGLDSLDQALMQRPDHPGTLNTRGQALLRLDRLPDALASFDRVVALVPEHPTAWIDRGVILGHLGQPAAAIESLERAVALVPNQHAALVELARLLLVTGRYAEAIPCYDRALALWPDDPAMLAQRGNALWQADRLDEALTDLDRAVALAPDYPEALNDRANLLLDLNRYAEATACYDRALTLRPDLTFAQMNRGTAHQRMRRFDAALADYAAVLAVEPDNADAKFNQGLCWLALGDFVRGWPGYEWRPPLPRQLGFGRIRQPLWSGETGLAGKRILLPAEQGFGDTIQFSRFVPMLAAQGAIPLVAVQPALQTWLADLPGAARVLTLNDDPPDDCDVFCPLMSVPAALRLDAVPAFQPWLRADPVRVAGWRMRLAALPGLKVGVAWAGEPRAFDMMAFRMNRRRSMPLRHLAPLTRLPGVTLVSLQKGAAAAEARDAGLLDWTEELADFSDTAALVAALDLVVSVDTSIVHVAGALSVPVWVLNRYDRCWRWHWDRTDSAWYPSVRLFTQDAPGEWAPVVEAVRQALEGMSIGSKTV
jgi:tetratricopeptide (TPR) repeat protein